MVQNNNTDSFADRSDRTSVPLPALAADNIYSNIGHFGMPAAFKIKAASGMRTNLLKRDFK